MHRTKADKGVIVVSEPFSVCNHAPPAKFPKESIDSIRNVLKIALLHAIIYVQI